MNNSCEHSFTNMNKHKLKNWFSAAPGELTVLHKTSYSDGRHLTVALSPSMPSASSSRRLARRFFTAKCSLAMFVYL